MAAERGNIKRPVGGFARCRLKEKEKAERKTSKRPGTSTKHRGDGPSPSAVDKWKDAGGGVGGGDDGKVVKGRTGGSRKQSLL